jgi:hypothetical protein
MLKCLKAKIKKEREMKMLVCYPENMFTVDKARKRGEQLGMALESVNYKSKVVEVTYSKK